MQMYSQFLLLVALETLSLALSISISVRPQAQNPESKQSEVNLTQNRLNTHIIVEHRGLNLLLQVTVSSRRS